MALRFLVKVDRFSFSTPPRLMKQFDEALKAIGYKDRSKGTAGRNAKLHHRICLERRERETWSRSSSANL